eukprot:Rhum_TRINITY_DN17264_c0_g1::Rhum_TRINITY_DN17264_c0_g1_i1::g.165618::m.165618
MATPLADAAHEKLVVEALQSKEWREERSATADGGVKVWYWLRKDKKVKKASRRDLGAYLAKLAAEDAVPPAAGAAAASKPATGAAAGAPAGAAAPATTAPAAVENPDATKIASMGLLGTDLESMTDAADLRNQVRLWEAKYRVLLDENKRLLLGNGVAGQPAAGIIVPSDLQLKYDALIRQNHALHADLEVKESEVVRLSKTVEDLTEHKAKLEVQLGEAYQQAQQGLEAKLKLQEKDDIVERAGGFVNAHFQEQNKFLAAQVAELTALLHKVKEEDHLRAKITAAGVDGEVAAMSGTPLSAEERARVAVHFAAIVNSPARHVLCGKCRATLSRMVSSEGSSLTAPDAARPHPQALEASLVHGSDIHPHFDGAAAAPVLPRPAYVHNVALAGDAAVQQAVPVRPTTAPPQPAAVASFGGYIVRTKR